MLETIIANIEENALFDIDGHRLDVGVRVRTLSPQSIRRLAVAHQKSLEPSSYAGCERRAVAHLSPTFRVLFVGGKAYRCDRAHRVIVSGTPSFAQVVRDELNRITADGTLSDPVNSDQDRA